MLPRSSSQKNCDSFENPCFHPEASQESSPEISFPKSFPESPFESPLPESSVIGLSSSESLSSESLPLEASQHDDVSPVVKTKSDHSLLSLARSRSTRTHPMRRSFASTSDLSTDIVYHDTISSIEIIEEIGTGTYSTVYKGQRLNSGGDVIAVKIIDRCSDLEGFHRNFCAEESTLSQFGGRPGIVNYFGVVKRGTHATNFMNENIDNVGFSMKYYHYSDIYTYMESGKNLSSEQGYIWIMNVMTGLSVLHGMDPIILHRDIKSPNFLIDDDFSVRLTDFGLARADNDVNRSNTFREMRTSMLYSAPELFDCEQIVYRSSSDIYSLSIVIWEILSYVLTKKYIPPFQVPTQWHLPKIIVSGERPPINRNLFKKKWINFLEIGWNPNPVERPDIFRLIEMGKNLSIE